VLVRLHRQLATIGLSLALSGCGGARRSGGTYRRAHLLLVPALTFLIRSGGTYRRAHLFSLEIVLWLTAYERAISTNASPAALLANASCC